MRRPATTDFVTRADQRTQTAVVDCIRETFPDATVVGEENGAARPVPADGTANFVRGNRRWATSVACLVDGQPVTAANVHPALDDTYVVTPDGVFLNGERVTVSERTDPERFSVVPTVWWGRDCRDAGYRGAIRRPATYRLHTGRPLFARQRRTRRRHN